MTVDVPLPGFGDVDVYDTVRAARIAIRYGLGSQKLLTDRMHIGLRRARALLAELHELGIVAEPCLGDIGYRTALVGLDRLGDAEEAVRSGRRIAP